MSADRLCKWGARRVYAAFCIMGHLADSPDLVAKLLEASPDGLFLVGPDGDIRWANPQAGVLFGRTVDNLIGSTIDELVPADQRERHAEHRQSFVDQPAHRPMGTDLRLLGQRADGSLFPVEVGLRPATIDDELCTVAAVRDVSERQDALARVALLNDRERIARDLHDLVIQRIFAAGMSLQAVTALVDSAVVEERISAVTDELDETIRQLRQSIFHLGHDEATLTLSARIMSLVDERADHLGFVPDISITGPVNDLSGSLGDQLMATLTEALSNVARHANASAASVEIECTDGTVSLVVRDNGVGITQPSKPRGGLSNMMWRAAELGGNCAVEPSTPQGTLLTWSVPVLAAHG